MIAVDELTLLGPDTGEPRRPADPVTASDDGIDDVVERMLYIICRTGHPSLSGPQVGLDRRIVAVDLSRTGRRPVVLVNPEIEDTSSETQVDTEGCLHHPGVLKRVERPVRVTVTGRAPSGEKVRLHAGGLLGRLLQHQIDHLEGRPFGGEAAASDGGRREEGTGAATARWTAAGDGAEPARTDPPGPGDGRSDRPAACSTAGSGASACRLV